MNGTPEPGLAPTAGWKTAMWPGCFEVFTRIDCHLPARETLPAGGCRELFTGSGGHLRDAERLGIAFGSRRIRGQSRVTSAQGRKVGREGPQVRMGAMASSAIRLGGPRYRRTRTAASPSACSICSATVLLPAPGAPTMPSIVRVGRCATTRARRMRSEMESRSTAALGNVVPVISAVLLAAAAAGLAMVERCWYDDGLRRSVRMFDALDQQVTDMVRQCAIVLGHG